MCVFFQLVESFQRQLQPFLWAGYLPYLTIRAWLARSFFLFFSHAYLHSHNRVTYLTSEVVLSHSDDDWRFVGRGKKGEGIGKRDGCVQCL